MSRIPDGPRRTFFAICEAGLRWLGHRWSNGLIRLDAWADWCGERAR